MIPGDPHRVAHLIGSISIKIAQHVVIELLGIENEQTRILKRIEAKIDATLASSYNQGRIYLQEALAQSDETRRRDSLKHAEERFIEAVTNFESVDPMRSAWAAIYLTVICQLNGRSSDEAGRWAIRAHRAAVSGVQEQCLVVNRVIDTQIGTRLKLTSRGPSSVVGSGAISFAATTAAVAVVGAGAGALFLPVGIATFAGMKAYRSHRIRQGREALTALEGFTEQLRETVTSLSGRPIRGYVLSFDDDSKNFAYTRPLALEG